MTSVLVVAVEEPGHVGHLVVDGVRAVVVDCPLDVDAALTALEPGTAPVAVVETGLATDRIGGGRLLAEATRIPLFAPPACIAGARPLQEGSAPPELLGMVIRAAPGRGPRDVALVHPNGEHVMIGGLDAGGWVAEQEAIDRIVATRARLRDAYPGASFHGSAGRHDAAELADAPLPATGPQPLNLEAVTLTNRGEADMYWADPRFVVEAPAITPAILERRAGTPWAPLVVDLRSADDPPIAHATRVGPARLASAFDELAGERDLVVVADDDEMAARAAGFLMRLGLRSVAWSSGP